MIERRSFLRGMAGLPAVPILSTGQPAARPGRIVALWRECQRLSAAYVEAPPECGDADLEWIWDTVAVLEAEAIGLRASTVEEAVAALEWARYEVTSFMLSDEPDAGQQIVCVMIDGALNVLRRQMPVIGSAS